MDIEYSDHKRRMVLYQQGLRDYEIAQKLRLKPQTITKWRTANNLPSNFPANQNRINDEMIEKILQLYHQGKNDCEIAKELKLSSTAICQFRKKRKLPANAKKGGRHDNYKPLNLSKPLSAYQNKYLHNTRNAGRLYL